MPTPHFPAKSGCIAGCCAEDDAAAEKAKLQTTECARESLRTRTPHLEMHPYGVLMEKIL
jgi:hypothetical protein